MGFSTDAKACLANGFSRFANDPKTHLATVKIIMVFDGFRTRNAKTDSKQCIFVRFYKGFLIVFCTLAKACLANGFPRFVDAPKTELATVKILMVFGWI